MFTAYYFTKSQKIVKIPSIQHKNSLEITFQKKSKIFLKTMFPSPSESTPTALKTDDSDTIAWKLTTFKEIEQAIKSSSLRKASNSDKISFLILQKAFQTISGLFFCYICKITE